MTQHESPRKLSWPEWLFVVWVVVVHVFYFRQFLPLPARLGTLLGRIL